MENQTPSPVSIPLPLSIAPKNLAHGMTKATPKYSDQHGWSPFEEKRFPDVFLSAPHLHPSLLNQGGFLAFWEAAGLPEDSAPAADADALSQEQVCDLLRTAHRVKRVTPNAMAFDAFSPWVASNVNKFAPLARHHQDYSGEVSTVDISTIDVCSEAGTPCSDRDCKACVTRDSYESSGDRSTLSSVSGYESDMSATTSDKENIRLAGTLTPSRLPRPVAGDKTPKQTDYTNVPIQPLNKRAEKYFRGSETSDMTTSTVRGMSEDEKFAKRIV